MDRNRSPRRFAARTKQRLVLGGIAATSISLGACSSEPPKFNTAEFTTVSACTSAGFPDALCQASYNAAFLEHQRSAPQFASRTGCEDDWGSGQCTPLAGQNAATNTGSGPWSSNIFVPALAGFVVSQALQQRYYDTGDVDIGYYGGYGGGYRGTPVYRNRSGGTVTVDSSSGKAVSTPVNVNTRTVSSRGFGGMSMSRGGGGWGG